MGMLAVEVHKTRPVLGQRRRSREVAVHIGPTTAIGRHHPPQHHLVVAAHEPLEVGKPRRMVDEALEGLADLEEIVQVASFATAGVAVDLAAPLVRLKVEVGIEPGVELFEVGVADGIFEAEIAAKVEEVFL